jgi:PAS domain S-box-containing protein
MNETTLQALRDGLHYRALFDNSHTMMLIIDPADGAIVDANAQAAKYYGWPRETLLGMRIMQINTLPPEQIRAEMERARQEDRSFFNFRHRLSSGEMRDVEVFAGPIQIDGHVLLYSIVHDVTERKRQEEELSLLARRATRILELPALAESLGEAEFMQRGLEMVEDLTGSPISFIHFVNDDGQTIELVTWSRRTLASYCTAAFDRHYPVDTAGIWAEALRQRRPVVFNDYAIAPGKRGLPDGHAALTRLISLPVIEGERVVMLAGIGNKPAEYAGRDVETLQMFANDIWSLVRRRRAETELRDALRALENSPVVSFRWLARKDWPVDHVSRNVARWGYRPEDLLAGRPTYSEMIHPEDRARVATEVAERTAAGMTEYVQSYRLRAADGRYFWVEDSTHVIRDDAGAAIAYEGVVTDDDARKRYEIELAETLEQQRTLNKRLEAAQSQLLQSEKMASIGQLAAGVAHELNNPIGFVNSNLGSLENYLRDLFAIADAYAAVESDCPGMESARALMREKDYDFLREDIVQLLAESRDGLARVAKIVRDLKDFSRPGEEKMDWADLHQGLDSTLNVVWNELKYKCEVKKEYGELPPVRCALSQLNQVFMNLLVNAGHAIPEKGEIAIRTGRRGDEVFVAIADTGTGIPPENLKRIFDPFFTTKPVGKGTGLGLSLSYGIVQKHGGRIEVASEVGKGTTFTVWLPVEPPADAGEADAP